jgi:hypothetical protein
MNATTQIINILTACGCKPAATTDKSGAAVIKVNAPYIIDVNTLFDTDAAELEYMEDMKK